MAWSTLGNSSSFVPEVSKKPLYHLSPPILRVRRFAEPEPRIFIHIAYVPTRTHTRKKKVFKYEPFFFAVVLMYGAFFWFGSKANYTKANTWFVASSPKFFARYPSESPLIYRRLRTRALGRSNK